MATKKLKTSENEYNEAINKVISWFLDFPLNEISLTELSEQLLISKATANKVVKLLVQEEFLILKDFGRLWRISCNTNHPFNITKKIPYHLELIYQSNIVEIIKQNIPNYRAIILFGSYRKGDDTEKSDIDIAVETLDNEEASIIELGTLSTIGFRKKVVVNIHKFSRKKIDLNLFSNIANGILLDGFLEVRP